MYFKTAIDYNLIWGIKCLLKIFYMKSVESVDVFISLRISTSF